MTEEETAALAKAVVAELGSNIVPGVLPLEVGYWFRQAFEHGNRQFMFITPVGPGPEGLRTIYNFQVDGSLLMELADVNGRIFWSGTLRPVGR